MSQDEQDNEFRLLKEWGILTDKQAEEKGIAWPDDPQAKGGFKDTWSWHEDIHPDWIASIKITHPAVNMLLETTRHIHGDSISAYLAFMAIRLFEIHRILKPTGSLYLHCDHTADGYLRQLLDAVFNTGGENKPGFRNAITWRRTHSKNAVSSRYGANHDTIFYYGKTTEGGFDKEQAFRPFENEIPPGYSLDKKTGRYYALSPLHAPGNTKSGESGKPVQFRGKEYPVPANRHWTVPGGKQNGEDTAAGWDRLDKQGRIYVAPDGKLPMFIRYLDEMPGIALDDVWTDIKIPGNKERTGYPTQKPMALAERIIKASCPPGGVVLDCFAGCAYVALAAEKLGRRWTACDINPRAWTVFKRQFNKGGKMPILTCADTTTGQQVMSSEPTVTLHGPDQLPDLKTSREVEIKPLITPPPQAPKPKAETTLMSRHEMLVRLLALSNGRTWCCGLIYEGSDGQLLYTNYELDHIIPKSKGGEDEIINRAPLCSAHNKLKSDNDWTIEELRVEVAHIRELAKDMTPSRLIKMPFALDQARKIYAEIYEKRKGRPLPFQPPVEAV